MPCELRRPCRGAMALALLLGGALVAAPAAAQTPPPATDAEQVAELVNDVRAGLAPLKLLPLLETVALSHSTSMAIHDFFSHYDPSQGCSNPGTRLTAAGYAWFTWAENVAAGSSTAQGAMNQWVGSSGHLANILNTAVREIGVGHSYQAGDQGNIDLILNSDCDCLDAGETCNYSSLFHYWTQVFGVRSTVYPLVIERERHQTSRSEVCLYVYGPSNATEMRFSNDGASWSAWQPFSTGKRWALAAGTGLRTVFSQVRNASTTYSSSDDIWRAAGSATSVFGDGFECDGTGGWSDSNP